MTFKELKNTICPAYKTYYDAVRDAERNWLVTNNGSTLWVSLHLASWDADDISVSVSVGRAEYSQELRINDLSLRELELIVGVRRFVDRWMQNEIPELPQTLPAELTDIVPGAFGLG